MCMCNTHTLALKICFIYQMKEISWSKNYSVGFKSVYKCSHMKYWFLEKKEHTF